MGVQLRHGPCKSATVCHREAASQLTPSSTRHPPPKERPRPALHTTQLTCGQGTDGLGRRQGLQRFPALLAPLLEVCGKPCLGPQRGLPGGDARGAAGGLQGLRQPVGGLQPPVDIVGPGSGREQAQKLRVGAQ